MCLVFQINLNCVLLQLKRIFQRQQIIIQKNLGRLRFGTSNGDQMSPPKINYFTMYVII